MQHQYLVMLEGLLGLLDKRLGCTCSILSAGGMQIGDQEVTRQLYVTANIA